MKYLYHGTSTTRLREILKKGLIGNPKQRVFSDKNTRDYKIKTAAFGVYLAPKCPSALAAASRAVEKFGGNRAIITIKYNPKRTSNFLIDEDDIKFSFEGALKAADRVVDFRNPLVLEAWMSPQYKNFQKKVLRKAFGLFLRYFRQHSVVSDPKLLPKLTKDKTLYRDFVTAARTYLMWVALAYADSGKWQLIEIKEKLPKLFPNGKPVANKKTMYKAYLTALLRLGKHFRRLVSVELRKLEDTSERSGGSNIILPYVGFRGKTRIVAIVAGVTESLEDGYKYKVIYNKDPKAVELLKKCIRTAVARDAEFV